MTSFSPLENGRLRRLPYSVQAGCLPLAMGCKFLFVYIYRYRDLKQTYIGTSDLLDVKRLHDSYLSEGSCCDFSNVHVAERSLLMVPTSCGNGNPLYWPGWTQRSLHASTFPSSIALSLTKSRAYPTATLRGMLLSRTQPKINFVLYIWYCSGSGFGPHFSLSMCLLRSSLRRPRQAQDGCGQ